MKKRALCMMVGILILCLLSAVGAQQTPGKQQSSSANLPAEACQAVQQYVARIDAARSMNETVKREQTYAQAQKELEPVLLRYKQAALVDAAAEYARLTETIVKAYSTNPKLPELLDNRLKTRAKLLDHCDD